MKPNDDQRVIFKQISIIENQYCTATQMIVKEDLIEVVLDAATREYQAVLTSEQRAQRTGVTLAHLEMAMNQH
jgi:hypothetical protein